MSIHVKTGIGSPIDNNVEGSPSCHYVDLDTGDQWLFGIDDWVPVGGDGAAAMSVLTQDASSNAGITLDFTHTDVVLYNAPGSGNIMLGMSTIDPTSDSVTLGKIDVLVLSETPVEFTNGYGGAYVSLHDGITFSADVLTPPSGAAGMHITIKQLGDYPESGSHVVSIEASAFTAQTQVNM